MSKLKALWAYILAEPTAAAAIIQAVVPALVFFHAVGLSDIQLGIIAAAISAVLLVVVAFFTHHPTYTVMVGAVQALVALGGAFGAHVSAHDLAVIIFAVGVIGHASNWAGSSSRVLAPVRSPLGTGPYKPEESPTWNTSATDPMRYTGNVVVQPAKKAPTKRAAKKAPSGD